MRNTGLRWRWPRVFRSPAHRLAARLLERADELRDVRRFRDAAILYEQVFELRPSRIDVQVQAGHMFKEAGDPARAEHHYLAAAQRLPHDADLALQLGHFYKVADQPVEAMAQFRRALALQPGWGEPLGEIAHIEAQRTANQPADANDDEAVIEALLPRPVAAMAPIHAETIELRRLGGRRGSGASGLLPRLFGIEAIRGVCRSHLVLDRVELHLDGTLFHAEAPVAVATAEPGMIKHVFNLWVDFGNVEPGAHRLMIVLSGRSGATIRRQDDILVGAPLTEADHPDSDGVVEIDCADPRPIEAQIRARPTMVRPPAHATLRHPIRSILVLRVDQLGDMVVSVPALRRMRELFPEARIVGLLTDANAELGRSLGLFDEIVTTAFPDDPGQRRRTMTRDEQAALRARLADYAFDVAIDLSGSHFSRPLLRLSGARYLHGFHDEAFTWLSSGLEGGTHDAKNWLECAPQSGRIRALVERLGTIVDSGAAAIRRDDIAPARLDRFGIERGRYIVLHMGARLAFTSWAGYPALAHALIERTAFDIVLLTDDPAARDTLPAALVASARIRLIDQKLGFDDFDALLSFGAAFVGNDSGPKHLAALRGVPVVSLHSARVNWNEWGQEIGGVVLSRRVPCAGCALHYDAEECGKEHACIADIRVSDVLDATLALLEQQA